MKSIFSVNFTRNFVFSSYRLCFLLRLISVSFRHLRPAGLESSACPADQPESWVSLFPISKKIINCSIVLKKWNFERLLCLSVDWIKCSSELLQFFWNILSNRNFKFYFHNCFGWDIFFPLFCSVPRCFSHSFLLGVDFITWYFQTWLDLLFSKSTSILWVKLQYFVQREKQIFF